MKIFKRGATVIQSSNYELFKGLRLFQTLEYITFAPADFEALSAYTVKSRGSSPVYYSILEILGQINSLKILGFFTVCM